METTKSKPSGLKLAKEMPFPIRILRVEGFAIWALWNTGEIRKNDFSNRLEEWKHDAYLAPITDTFNTVTLIEDAFGWPSKDPDAPILIDPNRCYEASLLLESFEPEQKLSKLLRDERLKAGLTQAELAGLTGYTSNYISKIESGKTDVQFGKLAYIFLVGLGKQLQVEEYIYPMAA
jgi:hypothetical protein